MNKKEPPGKVVPSMYFTQPNDAVARKARELAKVIKSKRKQPARLSEPLDWKAKE